MSAHKKHKLSSATQLAPYQRIGTLPLRQVDEDIQQQSESSITLTRLWLNDNTTQHNHQVYHSKQTNNITQCHPTNNNSSGSYHKPQHDDVLIQSIDTFDINSIDIPHHSPLHIQRYNEYMDQHVEDQLNTAFIADNNIIVDIDNVDCSNTTQQNNELDISTVCNDTDLSIHIDSPVHHTNVWWSSTTDNTLDISYYLPSAMSQAYTDTTGISTLFEWQRDCLLQPNLLTTYSNLVLSASTSAGKTCVAEILLLRHVLIYHKQCYYILPFISIVNQKYDTFHQIIAKYNRSVALIKRTNNTTCVDAEYKYYKTLIVKCVHGQLERIYDNVPPDIIICTSEKAYYMITQHIRDKLYDTIGCIVIDEIHMISDCDRGYTIECLITKLLYQHKRHRIKIHKKHINNLVNDTVNNTSCIQCNHTITPVQLIGMSATVSNLSVIATWLSAMQYSTLWRPVPLQLLYLNQRVLYDRHNNSVRVLSNPSCDDKSIMAQYNKLRKSDQPIIKHELIITELVWNEIQSNNNVLIFCATKYQTVLLVQRICELLSVVQRVYPPTMAIDTDIQLKLEHERVELQQQLMGVRISDDDNDTSSNILYNGVIHGIVYHNSNLSNKERVLIESAYKKNVINVICATTSLSTGVNLPARTVIFHSLYTGYNQLTQTQFMQMCGRAGRHGYNESGEVICLPPSNQKNSTNEIQKILQYMNNHDVTVQSTLYTASINLHNHQSDLTGHNLSRLVLDGITNELVQHGSDIYDYIKCTLLSLQVPDITRITIECYDQLRQYALIDEINTTTHTGSTSHSQVVATHMGRATHCSGLNLNEYQYMESMLSVLQSCWISEPENIHLVYCIVPLDIGYILVEESQWMIYQQLYSRLGDTYNLVCQLLDVNQDQLAVCVYNYDSCSARTIRKYQRFYCALILCDVIDQHSTDVICQKYHIKQHVLRNLLHDTMAFGHQVRSLCVSVVWSDLVTLIEYIIDRLHINVSDDIRPLMSISGMKPDYAAALYNSNYTTVWSISLASVDQLHRVLSRTQSFIYSDTDDITSDNIRDDCELIINNAQLEIELLKQRDENQYITLLAQENNVEQAEHILQSNISNTVRTHTDVCRSVDTFDSFMSTWKQCHQFTFCIYGVKRSNHDHTDASIQYGSDEQPGSDTESDQQLPSVRSTGTDQYFHRVTSFLINKYNIAQPNITGMVVSLIDDMNTIKYYNIVVDEYVRHNDYQCYDLSNDIIWYNINYIMSHKQYIKQSMDIKSQCLLLQCCNVALDYQLRDPRIAHWVLDSDNKYLLSIQHLYDIYYNKHTLDEILISCRSNKQSIPSGHGFVDSDLVEYQTIPYTTTAAVDQCYLVHTVMQHLYDRMCDNQLIELYQSIEMPVTRIISLVEYRGIQFDKSQFMFTYRELQRKSEYIERFAHQLNGNQCFDLLDGQQCSDVLFTRYNKRKKWKLCNPPHNRDTYKHKHRSTGKPLVNKKVLDDLIQTSNHIMPCLIREYRTLQAHIALASQYIKYSLYHHTSQQYTIHTIVNQTASCTGRLTFTNANLQNITKQLTYIPVRQDTLHDELLNNTITIQSNGIINDNTGANRPFHTCTNQHLLNTQRSVLSGTPNKRYKPELIHCMDMRQQLQRGRLLQVHDRTIGQPYRLSSKQSLAQYWYKQSGGAIRYDTDQQQHIHQVQVRIYKSKGTNENTKYIYPADRIYREAAFIHDNQKIDQYGYFNDHKLNNDYCVVNNTQDSLDVLYDDVEVDQVPHNNTLQSNTVPYSTWYTLCPPITTNYRSCFHARPGYALIQADYDQVELRIWAHMSNDPNLCQQFTMNTDIFTSIASTFYQCSPSSINKSQRQLIKQFVYSILYGAGDHSTSNRLGITIEEAIQYRTSFFSQYPAIQQYMTQIITDCRNNHDCIRSLLGRQRYIHNINHINKSGERAAINSVIQGSCSDLIKQSMIKLYDYTQSIQVEYKDSEWCYLILAVHDELVYEVKNEYIDEFVPHIRYIMEHCLDDRVRLNVPLKVKMSTGTSWGTLKSID